MRTPQKTEMLQAAGRELLFSVTSKDLTFQSFTVSGAGGQGRDHVNTGVRYIHNASGAIGESREFREQKRNKRAALERLIKTPKFTYWVALETKRLKGEKNAEQIVEEMMAQSQDFKFEIKDEDGKWVEVHD